MAWLMALLVALLGGLPLSALAAGPAVCGAAADDPALRLLALSSQAWLVPAMDGDAQAENHGQVSNLLLVADGPRLWLLGSGPSPAFGARLHCAVERQLGRPVTDVLSPWARPELVLGVAGLGLSPSRHWAHAEVAAAMAAHCPDCAGRLRLRLGAAAQELGKDPVRLPGALLQGASGQLGPLSWWLLPRGAGQVVTVWRLPLDGGDVLWWAPGLLNGSGPADARDATLADLARASTGLAALTAADGSAARHLGEQGLLQGPELARQQQAYWPALAAAVRAALDAGAPEAAPAPAWPGLPAGWARHPWHGLNWQRAWREIEPLWLAAPPGS